MLNTNCPFTCPTTFPPSPPSRYPHARLHQQEISHAIEHILSMPTAAFDAYQKNDALCKTIRNYQYVVAELGNKCPYKNPVLGPESFRITAEAQAELAIYGNCADLHYEHAVPVTMVKAKLIALRHSAGPVTSAHIEDTVKHSEIVIVTRTQQQTLDRGVRKGGKGLQTKMPSRWGWDNCHLARICQVSAQIVGMTRMG
jgi:hypothetical protein